MAAEEAKKVEVPPVCATEPPPAKVETKAPEEKSTNDTKDVAIVEKPVAAAEEKAAEGSAHRDAELARVATEKKDALIKAWEESERSKVENRAQKKLAAIGAWENTKKAELKAQLKKIEEKLEMKKAKYTEKINNKIASLHKSAEEKRAITEAKRGESLLKTEEFSSKCRVSGASPKKLLRWFSN